MCFPLYLGEKRCLKHLRVKYHSATAGLWSTEELMVGYCKEIKSIPVLVFKPESRGCCWAVPAGSLCAFPLSFAGEFSAPGPCGVRTNAKCTWKNIIPFYLENLQKAF